MTRTVITFALALVTSVALASPVAAGGGGHGDDVCRGFGDGERLVLRDNCFDGVGHVATAGTTLTVVNEGQAPHTFTAIDGSFDSGTLQPGDTFELLIDEPGTAAVYCTLHASREGDGMAGRLTVVDDAAVQLAATEAAVEEEEAAGWGWWLLAAVLALGLAGYARHRWSATRRAQGPSDPAATGPT